MSYELAGNANTIYVDANTASSGFAIVVVFSVFVFLAVWNGFALFRRYLTLRSEYRGFAMDERTKRKGVFVGACILGALVCLGLYAMNPQHESEQAQQGAAAVKAVKERFGLEAHRGFVPYDPSDDQNGLIGNRHIDGGRHDPPHAHHAGYLGGRRRQGALGQRGLRDRAAHRPRVHPHQRVRRGTRRGPVPLAGQGARGEGVATGRAGSGRRGTRLWRPPCRARAG